MKLLMGFIILLVALVAVTGCTQPASTSAQNTTTAPVTEVTTVSTPVPTTVATMAPVTTTTTKVANLTAPAVNVTTAVVTTVAPVNVTPTATPASGVTTIHITRAGFTPQTDIVLPGTGVSFVNNDNVSLSVMTIGNNTGMFNSGAIIPGAAFPYTFSQNSGTIVYQLSNNANVTGTIIVTSQSNGNHSS